MSEEATNPMPEPETETQTQAPEPKRRGKAKEHKGKVSKANPILNEIELAAMLGASRGNLARCAEHFGVSRSAIRQFIDIRPELKELRQDIKEGLTDWVETKLYQLIEDNNVAAVFFYLKTQAKDRGYIERQEVDAKGGVLVVTEEIISADLSGTKNEATNGAIASGSATVLPVEGAV